MGVDLDNDDDATSVGSGPQRPVPASGVKAERGRSPAVLEAANDSSPSTSHKRKHGDDPIDTDRRRQQNREAQQRRRQRRKEEIAELEQKVQMLAASERALAQAESENRRLREAMFQKELEVMVMKRHNNPADASTDPGSELKELNKAYQNLVHEIGKCLTGPSKIKTEQYFQLLTKARLVCERINRLRSPGVANIVCPDLKQILDVMRTEGIEDNHDEAVAQDMAKWLSVVQSVDMTEDQVNTILAARETLIQGLQETYSERNELNRIVSSLFSESAVKLHRILSAHRTRDSITVRSPLEASLVLSVFEKLKQNLAHERVLRHQFEVVFLGTVTPQQFAAMIVAAYPEKPYCVAIANTLHHADVLRSEGRGSVLQAGIPPNSEN
eukprot:TRINITY_DN6459_c0_g1_i2.p1 TRINITY_DN6459_c0_g1~~TRINITY_DN6459_c0_g1_i2.p1  ORF type:complete len:385 (-),score=90.82 TRINITY_DN6459_c0_g1_i2:710-1864(-)